MTAKMGKTARPPSQPDRGASRPAAPHGLDNQTMQALFRQRVVQARLEVGRVDDPEERIADTMADRVMRSADGSCCSACAEGGACAEEMVRRAPAQGHDPPAAAGHAAGVRDGLANGGTPLPTHLRGFFEPRFGRDLGHVRLHTDTAAAASARSLGARAYALGPNIAFAAGRYQPDSPAGRHLLAHELAHVVRGGTRVRRQPASEPAATQQPVTPGTEPAAAHCTAVAIELPSRIVFLGNRGPVSATLSTSLPPGDYWLTYAPADGQFIAGGIGLHAPVPPRLDVSAPSDAALFGQYRDSLSREGVRLHVAGPVGGSAAVPQSSITPSYAAGLSDAELGVHADVYRTRLLSAADAGEYEAVSENLRLIQSEQLRRQASGLTVVGQTGRPPSLPVDGGYVLQPADDLAPGVVAGIPEGGLITIPTGGPPAPAPAAGSQATPESEPATVITITPLGADLQPLSGPGSGVRPTDITTPLASGSFATLRSVNAGLVQRGFAAAGTDAIGIVGVPRWFTPGAYVPESLAVWGHTAIYVRQGGVITIVRGFSPQMGGSQLLPFLRNARAVEAGTHAVPATIGGDAYLFTLTGARSIEYPVASSTAEALVAGLPPVGPVAPGGPTPPLYTARPAVYQACDGSNCVLWAVEEAEAALGGRIGPAAGEVSATALGGARTASQGRLIQFMRSVQAGEEAIAPAAASGVPVAAGMSRGLQVVKWGGRAFFVIGLAAVPLEIALAPPGQRLRTGVGATAGFAGGLAAGAAAGLVCGPGAPVCSVVLGITFGIAGAFGARALAESIFDALATLSKNPEAILAPPSATTLVLRGGYAGLLRSPADLAAELRRQAPPSGSRR